MTQSNPIDVPSINSSIDSLFGEMDRRAQIQRKELKRTGTVPKCTALLLGDLIAVQSQIGVGAMSRFQALVAAVRDNQYHDFIGDKTMLDLVEDLAYFGLFEIIQNVQVGKYDGTMDDMV